jgi:acyl-CoA synthetase (AMP-forming)/AMP-acid ligase II
MNDSHKSGGKRLHGAWAQLTIDALLETAVKARPGRRSFVDAPDIANWSDLTPRMTSVGEFGAMVARFSGQVRTLGLKHGDVVLVAMPNCVDGVATLIGLQAAGYVPCPVSVVASAAEMQEIAEVVQARAVITVNRYAEFYPSDAARTAASRFYGLRFVCAYGPGSPPGVVSLDKWNDAELSSELPPPNAPTGPALVTIDRNGGSLRAHVRTHAQIISDGLALSAISGLTGRGSIIATFAPVSAAGFASTVASPLISGTMVALHGPFDADVLRAQLAAAPEAVLVVPAAVEEAVRLAAGPSVRDTIVVTRDPSLPRPAGNQGRVTELLSLGEAALWSLLRDNTRSRLRLPRFYAHPVGTALPRSVPQLEISLSPRGRLALSGFGVAPMLGENGVAISETGAQETDWRVHSDGPEHFLALPEQANTGEAAEVLVVAAA